MHPVPAPAVPFAAVVRAFALGTVRSARPLPFGVLNRNWRIDADRGAFALKAIDAHDPDDIRRRLALLPRLADAGIPVIPAVPAADGDLVARVEGRSYCLTPWVEGDHPRGERMNASRSRHLGAVIGRIHTALADAAMALSAAPAPDPRAVAVQDAQAAITLRLNSIEAIPKPDRFDRVAAETLRRRLDLLARHGHWRPDGTGTLGPHGWIHGDCLNWNLLWSGDRITAVLDWDRLRPGFYAAEIARTAMYQFARADGSVDVGDIAALVAGYRSERAIGADALAEAARHRWWRIAVSDWHLKIHYDRGDAAADALFHSDERLLHWWTAHFDAVEAAFA